MGEVWKARDTRLNRIVAIKVLRGQHSARFEQEARAIAALNHPNICQIYDIGPDYLVLEYIEGKPLHGPFAPEEAVSLAVQIAAALEAAHAKGILHRDLKPGNVLLTPNGPKLLDFGLAKLKAHGDSEATQTIEGTVVGTAAYMSPEQAQGQPLDERSDIFSLGAVLYEMLSGRRAFPGERVLTTLGAVIHKDPEPLQAPLDINRIVSKCLRKSPSERYQTVQEVRSALATARLFENMPGEQPSIAVLPFANMSASKDDEYFSDGLAEEILNLLAHIPDLKVTARTSAFAFRGKEQDITAMANALKVRTILEGSVRHAGSRVRVTAQLINAADGYHLWSERYDRELTDVFAVQDEIAAAIAKALHVKLAPQTPRYQPKPAAHEAFLRGRHLLLQGPAGYARGKEYLEQAIVLDPNYSEPHAELGMYYLLTNINGVRPLHEMAPLARAEAGKALELNPGEPRAHLMLGLMAALECDWRTADEHTRRVRDASQIAPEVRVRAALAVDLPRGRFAEAIREAEIALEQDPYNALLPALFAMICFLAGQFGRARVLAERALELSENFWMPRFVMGVMCALRGELAQARDWAEGALQASQNHPMCGGLLAAVLVRTGEKEQADRLLGDQNQATPGALVIYHLLCSETEAAADWYEKAIAQKDPVAAVWAASELFKPLRESPRWPAIAKRLNLPDGV